MLLVKYLCCAQNVRKHDLFVNEPTSLPAFSFDAGRPGYVSERLCPQATLSEFDLIGLQRKNRKVFPLQCHERRMPLANMPESSGFGPGHSQGVLIDCQNADFCQENLPS